MRNLITRSIIVGGPAAVVGSFCWVAADSWPAALAVLAGVLLSVGSVLAIAGYATRRHAPELLKLSPAGGRQE